jgi:hypothetical protein
MKLLIAAVLLAGCQKATPEKACRHFKALANAQVDKQLKQMNAYGVGGRLTGMAADLKQTTKDFDVEQCAIGLQAKNVDTNCVADARTFDEATACMRDAMKESGTL